MLAVMLLSVGGTSAKTPGWAISTPVVNPDPVGPGNYALYSFTISNTGASKSNISALYLKTDLADTDPLAVPGWIQKVQYNGQTGPANPCGTNPPSGPFNCTLGALNYGSTIDFEIVFKVPATAGTYTFHLLATGNGNTPSDSGGTSHGDTLSKAASVTVSGSDEYDAGFTLGTGGTFDTTGTLGRSNKQNSSVTTPQGFVATTIQDSDSFTGTGTDPCADNSGTCIGQWTRVISPNPDGGTLKFEFLIYGKGLPGSVTAADITIVHQKANGDWETIGDTSNERCASATDAAGAPCIFVEAIGQNFHVIVYLLGNGSLRNQYG
jgi:hypothetical protein